MVRQFALRSAGGALAGLVAMTGMLVPAQAQTGSPAPLAKAGTLVGWGTPAGFPLGEAPVAAYTLPESLQSTAFTKVVANTDFTIALTAAGKVVVLGESGAPGTIISRVPASLATKTVTDIVSNGSWAGAVTSDGGVAVWGASNPNEPGDDPDPTDVPVGLADVAKLAIGVGGSAAAVKTNGEVVMWGMPGIAQTDMPDNLGAGVKTLVGGQDHYYALKADGNIVAWGRNNWRQTTLPASVVSGGHVTEVESGGHTGLALLDDGSLAYWGDLTYNPDFPDMPDIFPPPVPLPTELSGKTVVKISAYAGMFLAMYVEEGENHIVIWGNQDIVQNYLVQNIPSSLDEADIAGFSWGANYIVALTTKVREATKASITGTPIVNQTLTGTPATFSGSPDGTSSQWLAGGVAIPGATGTSLTLTPAQVGKVITFATTATKAGEESFISASAEVGPVQNPAGPPDQYLPPVPVKPTFKVSKAPTSKKKGKATVTVAQRAPRPKATGKATVTIKKGKTTKRIKVTLSGGKRSITLPKLKKGTWKVQISYNGDKNYKAQKSKTYNLKVKK